MKVLQTAAVASVFAFSVLAFGAMAPSSARADTHSSASRYCLQYGDNVVQCDFATLDQCHQTAIGLNGECYADVSRWENSFAYTPRMHAQRR